MALLSAILSLILDKFVRAFKMGFKWHLWGLLVDIRRVRDFTRDSIKDTKGPKMNILIGI